MFLTGNPYSKPEFRPDFCGLDYSRTPFTAPQTHVTPHDNGADTLRVIPGVA